MLIKDRIRGYLPVVVDIETSGFDENKHAILEICVIIIGIDEAGLFYPNTLEHFHVKPFEGADIDPSALKFNGIDIDHPFRTAVSEKRMLTQIFKTINAELKLQQCTRAILVGHNAFFDLGFLKSATTRTSLKSPFHQFSTLDTVSLSALYFGETVLAKAVQKAGIDWDDNNAHSAMYDCMTTAKLFCRIFNVQKYS